MNEYLSTFAITLTPAVSRRTWRGDRRSERRFTLVDAGLPELTVVDRFHVWQNEPTDCGLLREVPLDVQECSTSFNARQKRKTNPPGPPVARSFHGRQ